MYLVFQLGGDRLSSGQEAGRVMAQGATRPWSTYLFSAEKMPESHIPSKSIISIHTPVRGGAGRAAGDRPGGRGRRAAGTALRRGVHQAPPLQLPHPLLRHRPRQDDDNPKPLIVSEKPEVRAASGRARRGPMPAIVEHEEAGDPVPAVMFSQPRLHPLVLQSHI